MQVEATERGYFGTIHEVGEVFEVPDGEKAPWWRPVKKRKNAGADDPVEPAQDAADKNVI